MFLAVLRVGNFNLQLTHPTVEPNSGSDKVKDGVADGGGWPQWGGCRGADGV